MRRIRWKVLLPIIILLIVIIIGSGWYLMQLLNNDNQTLITFKSTETPIIEYGVKEYDSSTLVKSNEGEISKYPVVDTMKVGKQELIFIVTKDKEETEVPYTVEVKDTQKPVITIVEEKLSISIGVTFDPASNIKHVIDPVDGELAYIEKSAVKSSDTNYYTFESDVDTKTAGDYKVTIKAVDKNKNTTELVYHVNVTEKASEGTTQPSSGNAQTTPGTSQTTPGNSKEAPDSPTYIKGILIVNKNYGLPKDYIGNGPNGADSTAYNALVSLQTAAVGAGYDIPFISGYRSYEYQVTLYNNYVARDGQAAADRYSARPGYSEHQSGLCFDIGSIDNDYGDTAAGIWLDEHAHEFGFIIRYPDGKENITGYMYEPWHVRYVGVDVATSIWKSNITLEEYLGI